MILHASCVAVVGRAVLIRGASGTGKSALALELMSRGAALISDDRTCLTRSAGAVIASAPETLSGLIEARGVGILRAPAGPPSPVMLSVDLDRTERDRLPPPRNQTILGQSIPLLHKVDSAHFPAAILQYLTSGPWTHP
ncbi:MAG: serine kinase [Aestuariivita sp.]|jgi:HPr kinase/phosphorylase|nr:serine kinase [Aestuariivita sp.]